MVQVYVDEALVNLISTYFGQETPPAPALFDVTGDGKILVEDITWWALKAGTWVTIDEPFNVFTVLAVFGGLVGGLIIATML